MTTTTYRFIIQDQIEKECEDWCRNKGKSYDLPANVLILDPFAVRAAGPSMVLFRCGWVQSRDAE